MKFNFYQFSFCSQIVHLSTQRALVTILQKVFSKGVKLLWKTENVSKSKRSSKCHTGYVECKLGWLAEFFLPQVEKYSKQNFVFQNRPLSVFHYKKEAVYPILPKICSQLFQKFILSFPALLEKRKLRSVKLLRLLF